MTGPASAPHLDGTLRLSRAETTQRWRNLRAAWTTGWSGVRRRLRVARHRFWNHRVAATHVVFFIVAAAIFVPVTVGLFLYTRDLASSQKDGTAGLDSRASAALQEITSNPGLNAAGTSTQWEVGPTIDSVQQVGVRAESSSALSYTKVDNLQRGGIAAQTDAFLNYEEMRDSLHVGNKFDFHIRMYPLPETRTTDPYGAYAIKGTHVAYVANLTDHHVTLANHSFTHPSQIAKKEIAALAALNLGASNPSSGFDGKHYQPVNQNGALYLLPLPGNVYVNTPGPGEQKGDVIGDTSRLYQYTSGGSNLPYHRHFFHEYFQESDGDYIYDVLIFGSDVDLSRWTAYAANLTDFVSQGGTVVFLGNKNLPVDLVTDCTTAACAMFTTGTGQPVTTPDITNQIATIPNKLPITSYTTGTEWLICNQPGHDERKGFIPVWLGTLDGEPGDTANCHDLLLGMTSSDRFGAVGGTIIFSSIAASSFGTSAQMTPFFSNLLNYAVLRPLYLDYGREIPKDEPVSAASRVMSIELPTGNSRDVKMVFYLWHRA